jgi:hypothetical protein|tara:strand:- start:2455 stop:3393 length:939 start_codon:yes stop_codon:yes gene_type:complete
MGAWKQFTTKDVTITPFIADKGWNLTGSSMTGSSLGANIFVGQNEPYDATSQTGFVYSSSRSSIYNSVKQLYYTNYISSSLGDNVTTASIRPGVTREDDVLFGPIQSPIYDNYLQSSLHQFRYWPTGSDDLVSVIAIPTKLFGEKIIPYTFYLKYTGSSFPTGLSLTDDGDGNIISGSDSMVVGQIFYSHGLVVLTTESCQLFGVDVEKFGALPQTEINFSSSLTIYEQQYKCTILENEFGVSTNPSLLTSSIEGSANLEYYPFATASFFEPYITCVGLYNEAQQLVAVGKLSFPLPVSQFTDTTVIVNYDI